MRTTIAIDDELFAAAQEYAGVQEKSAVIRKALQTYVEFEASRRLARMGDQLLIWSRHLGGGLSDLG